MKRSAVVCTVALIALCAWSGAPAMASISVGVYIPPTGITYEEFYKGDVASFNQASGKTHAILMHYRGFDNTSADNTEILKWARSAGAVPFVTIVCGSWSYSSIIAGSHDEYLQANARAFRDFGDRILLCIDPEMNLPQLAINPTEFISMWRHIHDIFTRERANNIGSLPFRVGKRGL